MQTLIELVQLIASILIHNQQQQQQQKLTHSNYLTRNDANKNMIEQNRLTLCSY